MVPLMGPNFRLNASVRFEYLSLNPRSGGSDLGADGHPLVREEPLSQAVLKILFISSRVFSSISARRFFL